MKKLLVTFVVIFSLLTLYVVACLFLRICFSVPASTDDDTPIVIYEFKPDILIWPLAVFSSPFAWLDHKLTRREWLYAERNTRLIKMIPADVF